jgi:hypothetical protein
VLPWPPGLPTIRLLVMGIGYKFVSLKPGPRISRVSESVHRLVGRFVTVRGLEEGTLSIRIRV